MGNRAVITTKKRDLALYLHWNGGRDSVEAFLKYCELHGFRAPEKDCYGWARLCQVIANFIDPSGGLSVGIEPYTDDERANPGGNGIYVIEGWKIVDRIVPSWFSHEHDAYDLMEMLKDIDESQPEDMRLGAYLDSVEVPLKDVLVGDIVYVRDFFDGTVTTYEVIDLAARPHSMRKDPVPVIGKYGVDKGREGIFENDDNFITDKTVRIVPRVPKEA